MDLTPEEREAIRLRWQREHPGTDPPEEEVPRLLADVKGRATLVEGEAMRMLYRATRQAPTRSGFNSDYMKLFALYVFFPLLLLCAVVLLVLSFVQAG